MPVADALAAILAGAEPLPEEMIALDDAFHRVLARDVPARGRRLPARDLSLAAGMNSPELAVRRRPKVAALGTGDELVMPGVTPGPGQIVYSNGYGLRALARAEGAEVIDLGIAADTIAATAAGIRRAREAAAAILIT